MRKPRFKKTVLWLMGILVFLLITVIWCDRHIRKSAAGYTSFEAEQIPVTPVAVILGTVNELQDGSPNQYFTYRIDAAISLYRQGKVRHFIVSGDNHVEGYDEPEDMRQALIAGGVPDSCITADYAGFRTLDSILRGWKIFGLKRFLIISQKFHNERAVFLGRKYGLEVLAFNATDVSQRYGFRTRMREYLARVKACLDVYVFDTQPKFLGEPVRLPAHAR